ncbi:Tripartite tricarboxylate transporter TctB family protein [Pseudomonas sp. BAY1663]|uniref:tripartite tricarboxylate transporter TctB family protein n=1 Tax=Pseudomonas sp. BAY1663 TaxID=1439940 RepID=UPI00042E039E|nr:tripartite tricarboxylate transporter TctB family protein [Pseudomonas sp. BAY1663]EXF44706.1 Tripartite tricarboxylate transporter TctB family protein [Pseudomonas sp. BAY1663]
MNKHRVLLGLFGIALAGLFFVNALNYPAAAAEMPLIYSVTVALLSLAMVLAELLRRAPAGSGEASDEASEERPRPRHAAAFAVFALAIAYVAAIDTLGYLLSTVAFMAVALLVIRTVSVRFALVGTVALVAVVCLVFIHFLGLPVPLLPPAIS